MKIVLPSNRFVALRTARAAPFGKSSSTKHDPTSLVAGPSSRDESDTMTTDESKAFTAFTPNNWKRNLSPATSCKALAVASAAHRNSPVCVAMPLATPSQVPPSGRSSTTLARHRASGSLSNENLRNRTRCSEGRVVLVTPNCRRHQRRPRVDPAPPPQPTDAINRHRGGPYRIHP